MRKIMCRVLLFPLVFVATPLLYFIGWCLAGHEETVEMIRELLNDFWNTVE